MNFRRSHDLMTRSMFPYIPYKLVSNINERVDNPTMSDVWMNNTIKSNNKQQGFTKNPYDVFGLTKQGHRSRNHDLLSGMFMGAVQAQKQNLPMSYGINAALAHQMQDHFSNHLVRSLGVTGRNVYEALMMSVMQRRYR